MNTLSKTQNPTSPALMNNGQSYKLTVRQYMTKVGSPDFDFMQKWNNNIPMPMRTMVGTVLEQTRGMVRMRLRGSPEPTSCCLVCGRTIKHPVSLLLGVGPECGQHFHKNPLKTKEDLDAAYEDIKNAMEQLVWEGWVVRSAITEVFEIDPVEFPVPDRTVVIEEPQAPEAPVVPEVPVAIPVLEPLCPRDPEVRCGRNLVNDGEPCADCSVGRSCCTHGCKGKVKLPCHEFCEDCEAAARSAREYREEQAYKASLPRCKHNESILCDHPARGNECKGCSSAPVVIESPVTEDPISEPQEPTIDVAVVTHTCPEHGEVKGLRKAAPAYLYDRDGNQVDTHGWHYLACPVCGQPTRVAMAVRPMTRSALAAQEQALLGA